MNVEEFIDEYSWQRAKEMQAEMLAQGSRRPKQWTFLEKDGSKYTLYFDGCPFKLKSSKMVDWLRIFVLSTEASTNESGYNFSAYDKLRIQWASVLAQAEGNLCFHEMGELPQVLSRPVVEAKCFDEGLAMFACLKNIYDEKIQTEELADDIYWGCVQGALLCCLYLIELSLKTDQITDTTFEALNQLELSLNECIAEAEADDADIPDFSVGGEYFERLTKLIPIIEKTGNKDLIHKAYEFAYTYFQASRRFSLAEQFKTKLKNLGE